MPGAYRLLEFTRLRGGRYVAARRLMGLALPGHDRDHLCILRSCPAVSPRQSAGGRVPSRRGCVLTRGPGDGRPSDVQC